MPQREAISRCCRMGRSSPVIIFDKIRECTQNDIGRVSNRRGFMRVKNSSTSRCEGIPRRMTLSSAFILLIRFLSSESERRRNIVSWLMLHMSGSIESKFHFVLGPSGSIISIHRTTTEGRRSECSTPSVSYFGCIKKRWSSPRTRAITFSLTRGTFLLFPSRPLSSSVNLTAKNPRERVEEV